jgi:hypothetical protein
MRNRYYVFRARGTLPERAREAFCDMVVEEAPAGATLRGTVIDDSHLHGILEQLRVLGWPSSRLIPPTLGLGTPRAARDGEPGPSLPSCSPDPGDAVGRSAGVHWALTFGTVQGARA